MKTNKEKNQEHDARAKARVRPAPKEYDWEPLQEAINAMIKRREHEQA
jgi:hypothetical protein